MSMELLSLHIFGCFPAAAKKLKRPKNIHKQQKNLRAGITKALGYFRLRYDDDGNKKKKFLRGTPEPHKENPDGVADAAGQHNNDASVAGAAGWNYNGSAENNMEVEDDVEAGGHDDPSDGDTGDELLDGGESEEYEDDEDEVMDASYPQ